METIKDLFRVIYQNKKSFIGLLILIFFILMATVGTHIYKLDMNVNFDNRYQPPSWQHWLGTDYGGRDTWIELVYGSKDVLTVAFWAALITMVIGCTLGALAGFLRGIVDKVIDSIINVVLSIPYFSLMLILAAIFKIQNPVAFGMMIAITSWAGLARGVRSVILSVRERDYVTVARVMGMSTYHIITKELLPNVIPYLTINFIYTANYAIGATTAIMLLGLAPYSPTNWGQMLSLAVSGTGGIFNAKGYFYFFSPIICLTLFSQALLMLADGLADFANPRLRKQ